MIDFVYKLTGPYFSFLRAEKDEYWERRGGHQAVRQSRSHGHAR